MVGGSFLMGTASPSLDHWATADSQAPVILGELEAEASSGGKKGRGQWLAICGRSHLQDAEWQDLGRTQQMAPPSST